jgi:hypothetical protein
MTHEQYIDEPLEAIQWLTRIHDAVETVKADKRREAERRG